MSYRYELTLRCQRCTWEWTRKTRFTMKSVGDDAGTCPLATCHESGTVVEKVELDRND